MKTNPKIYYLKYSVSLLICVVAVSLMKVTNLHAQELQQENQIIWWVAADPHVGDAREDTPGERLSTSVADINQLGIVDYAVMLGDLVADCEIQVSTFIHEMNKLEVDWTYVLGNHDFDSITSRPVLPPNYIGRTIHGIRFIFISDEVSGNSDRNLVMSKEQEIWFMEELKAHKDKPVFIFAHQPHWNFNNWSHIQYVLKDYNIAAWFSGHTHGWNLLEDSGEGFTQINIHSIGGVRDNYLSTILYIERIKEMVKVTVRFRNHEIREFIKVEDLDHITFFVEIKV